MINKTRLVIPVVAMALTTVGLGAVASPAASAEPATLNGPAKVCVKTGPGFIKVEAGGTKKKCKQNSGRKRRR